MDEGADRDAGDDPVPDFADDLLDRVPTSLEPVDPGQFIGLEIDVARANIADPFLEPAFEMQTADDPARDNRNREAEGEIGQGDLPPQQREEQTKCDLVDHRCGDQEGEGDAKRHACGDEADKQRHG